MLHHAIPRKSRCRVEHRPAGGRLRAEQPGTAVVGLVERYDSWTSDADFDGVLMLLPGLARLCLPVGEGDATVTIGARRSVTLEAPMLIAPTSLPVRVMARNMSVFVVTLTPAGSVSIGGTDVASNRAVPLTAVTNYALEDRLNVAAEQALTTGLRHALDPALEPLVMQTTLDAEEEAIVVGFGRLIAAGAVLQATEAAARLDVPAHMLRRTITRRFGFPPKMLLMRARFLRVLARMRAGERDVAAAIRGEYYDQSHFLRDGNRFLGMTPRRLLQSGVAFID